MVLFLFYCGYQHDFGLISSNDLGSTPNEAHVLKSFRHVGRTDYFTHNASGMHSS
jgi:hypothetical protein